MLHKLTNVLLHYVDHARQCHTRVPRSRLLQRIDHVTNHSHLSQSSLQAFVRAILDHPLLAGLLLLLPVLFLLQPLPVDETRYLAVAWEMRQSGDFLVPHLNGATYAHKPPMLFWLINLGWWLTGVHAWTARAITLSCSLLSLLLLYRLSLRLTASKAAGHLSMWVLLGAIYFASFANAIMFDVLLTTCVLLAMHGVCDLAEGRMRRGILITGVALGLGILVKGPVMLLNVLFVALAAPWWSADRLVGRRGRYFGACAIALVLGAAIALAWAIPAALHGGDDYARAIFLNQTFDRIEGVKGTSAHERPWWWYTVVFPLMLLPWPLVVRGSWTRLRGLIDEPAMRLALAWLVPTFIVFSLISGKQPHYLLPMIPAVALGLGLAMDRSALHVRSGLFAVLLIGLGIGVALLPLLAAQRPDLPVLADISPWWGTAIGLLGLVLLGGAWNSTRPSWPALATLTLMLLVKIVIVEGPGQRYDVTAAAQQVRAAQQRGQAIVHLGWHHGVYEFAGRLTEPLPVLRNQSSLVEWAKEHPDGLVMGFARHFRFRAQPVFTQPFRGGEISIWNARDAETADIDPAVAHSRDDSADDEGE